MPYLSRKQPIDDAALYHVREVITHLTGNGILCSKTLDDQFVQVVKTQKLAPYISFQLQQLGYWEAVTETHQTELHQSLLNNKIVNMVWEPELKRIFSEGSSQNINLMLIKGNVLGRTTYPSAECRPTSDFDIIVPPDQLLYATKLLKALGYQPSQSFVGSLILAAQEWRKTDPQNGAEYAVDLHWDISNRLYFRHRIDLKKLFDQGVDIEVDQFQIRAPCSVDNLIIACLHLAAMNNGVAMHLLWLLDIYLLMIKLSEADIESFIQKCQKWKTTEACWIYCNLAAKMGTHPQIDIVLKELKASYSNHRLRFYDNTIRYRSLDLLAFFSRLPKISLKRQFIKEVLALYKYRQRPNYHQPT